MADTTDAYCQKLRQTPLLTADQERQLSEAIRRGRDAQHRNETGKATVHDIQTISAAAAAKDQFIRANLRLVVSIAYSYNPPPGMELLDLVQEGNIGLHRAVERYDGRRGTRFSVYARHWIRREISEAITDKAPLVRIPAGRLVHLRAALDAVGAPERLDAESRRVHRLRSHASLDTPPNDRSRALVDMIADTAAGPEEQAVARAVSETLVGMVEQLPGTQRHAVSQRFGLVSGEPRTCRDIAEDLGVTPQAVWGSAAQGIRSLTERCEELRAA